MPRPAHFEIHADDPERACGFYEAVFGWSIQQWGDNQYWLIDTSDGGPGIDGGVIRRKGPTPSPDDPVSAFVVSMSVPDIDATIGAIDTAGGSIAVPKHAVPGVGWLAYCKDTEANLFAIMQEDPNAA